MIDVRCGSCNVILAKVVILVGAIKCKSCKKIIEYNVYTNNLFFSNKADPRETKALLNVSEHDKLDSEPKEANPIIG